MSEANKTDDKDFGSRHCSSSVDVLFLRWLKQRIAESTDKEPRQDVLLRINANFRELLMENDK